MLPNGSVPSMASVASAGKGCVEVCGLAGGRLSQVEKRWLAAGPLLSALVGSSEGLLSGAAVDAGEAVIVSKPARPADPPRFVDAKKLGLRTDSDERTLPPIPDPTPEYATLVVSDGKGTRPAA